MIFAKSSLPFDQHMVTVRTTWRRLPHFLEVLREVPIDIRRAYIQPTQSTIFVSYGPPFLSSNTFRAQLEQFENEKYIPQPLGNGGKIELPMDAKVMLYNVPNTQRTTMEFYCKDRVGLLSDLLQYISHLDVDITTALITTMDDQVHNIINLQKDGKCLEPFEILYIRNVFEHDVKPRFRDCNDLL